jgi:phosphohistidine phosphatase
VKTLFVLRHAKSSWEAPDVDDHERMLSPRGVRAAELMAVYLAQCPVRPALALSSTARRALDTAAPIHRRLGIPCLTDRGLYLAEPDTIRARITQLDEPESSVLLIGHNPGLHDLAYGLTGNGDRAARARLRKRFPTAALAVLQFDAARWSDVEPGRGTLVEFTTPADLV